MRRSNPKSDTRRTGRPVKKRDPQAKPQQRSDRKRSGPEGKRPFRGDKVRNEAPGRFHPRERPPVTKFYGVRACSAIFTKRPLTIHRVFLTDTRSAELPELVKWCSKRRVPLKVVEAEELSRVSATEHHEGICIEADPLRPLSPKEFEERLITKRSAVVLYLEGIENPHNVGAILRTAGFSE